MRHSTSFRTPNILQEKPYVSICHSQRVGECPLGFHNLPGLVDQFIVYYLLLSADLFFFNSNNYYLLFWNLIHFEILSLSIPFKHIVFLFFLFFF